MFGSSLTVNRIGMISSTHNPIYCMRERTPSTPPVNHSIIYDVNRDILKRYALRALENRGMLSPRLVDKSIFSSVDDPGPEKTFTVQVYDEDLGRHDGRVWFANNGDVNTLVSVMIAEVGDDRMHMIKRSIGTVGNGDKVEEIGRKWLKKWNADEDWPLAK